MNEKKNEELINSIPTYNAYGVSDSSDSTNSYTSEYGFVDDDKNIEEQENVDGEYTSSKYYTYENNEFGEASSVTNSNKGRFARKLTATIGFAATFGIIAGLGIHFTGEYFGDNKEKVNVSIGGNNSSVSGSQAIKTTAILQSDVETLSDVSDVAQAVMPSVVAITETSVQSVGSWYGTTEQEVEGSGSGIIIKEDGENLYIVTNNHVIAGAKKINVTFSDGTSSQATVKGAVSSEDIAIITVKKEDVSDDTINAIKIASLGNSDDIKVGQAAIAIGNALGYGQSVTSGVISAKDREITVRAADSRKITIKVLQTDAAINPGNSGGALLNASGQVIGINSAKLASDDVEGMGYAIPISNVLNIINDIIEKEEIPEDQKGYLGIMGGTITQTQQSYYGLPSGVYISSVEEDGPASKAGLLKGDVITGINDVEVDNMDDLSEQIKGYKIGTKVKITYQRLKNGKYVEDTIDVVLDAYPTTDDKSDSNDKVEKNDKIDTPDKSDNDDKKDTSDKSDNDDKKDTSDKSDNDDRKDTPDKSDNDDRKDTSDKSDNNDKKDSLDKSDMYDDSDIYYGDDLDMYDMDDIYKEFFNDMYPYFDN